MPITVTFQREAVQTLGTVIEQAIFAHVVARLYHAHQRVQHAQICKEETKYGERPFKVFGHAIIIQLARQVAFSSSCSPIEEIDLSAEQGNTIDDVFGAGLKYVQTHPWPTMSSLVHMYRVKKSKIRSTEPKDSPDLAKRREIETRKKDKHKKKKKKKKNSKGEVKKKEKIETERWEKKETNKHGW